MGNIEPNYRKYKTFGKNRSLRLKSFNYSEPNRAYFLALCTRDKETLFTRQVLCARILDSLKSACQKGGYSLLAYCIMPDHLHMLIQGGESPLDLRDWVRELKKYTTRISKEDMQINRLWQRGYYEHVVRKDEDLLETAKYIVNNPLRKGLVSKSEDYRWQGICVV